MSEKAEPLEGVTKTMQTHGADTAQATSRVWETWKWLVTSDGHRIDQHIRECGAGMTRRPSASGETQRRCYPASAASTGPRGWELVRRLDLPGNAAAVAEEAKALLTAPSARRRRDRRDPRGGAVALQIHESVGHAAELDRILGWEAAFAARAGSTSPRWARCASARERMNITADATLPARSAASASTTRAPRRTAVDIVRDGDLGRRPLRPRLRGARRHSERRRVRADGFNRMPMVRMTNVGLRRATLARGDDRRRPTTACYMDTNRSWSIDDRRLNFQFGCEIGWEIKGGKLGRMLRNPTYTGISPRFWALDGHDRQRRRVDVLGHAELRQGPADARSATPAIRPRRRASVDPGGCARMTAERAAAEPAPAPEAAADLAERVLGMVRDRAASAEAEVLVHAGTLALTRFGTARSTRTSPRTSTASASALALDGRVASSRLDGRAGELDLSALVDGLFAAAPRQPRRCRLARPRGTRCAARRRALGRARPPPHRRPSGRVASRRSSQQPAASRRRARSRPRRRRVSFSEHGGPGGERSRNRSPRSTGLPEPARPTASPGGHPSPSGTSMGRRKASVPGGQARASANPGEIEPGRYEVVLSPSCVADLLGFLVNNGFGGRAVEERRSFVELGELQFDRLDHDLPGHHPIRGSPASRSMPRARRGSRSTSCGTASAARSCTIDGPRTRRARRAPAMRSPVRISSARSRRRPSWCPANPGSMVVRGVERGILVSDFWYTRVLDPRTLVVTGLTRNGVWLIEDGRVGSPSRTSGSRSATRTRLLRMPCAEFGSDIALFPDGLESALLVPSLRLASWNFTGGAKG